MILDYLSVSVLGTTAVIPFILDHLGISEKQKKILIITCLSALVVSVVFSLKGVNESHEKDTQLTELKTKNEQIHDSVVVITENTKKLRSNLIATLNLLEDFENSSSTDNSVIKKRLTKSAGDLRDIIDQSTSLASTSTQTQKLLYQVIEFQREDSIQGIKNNIFQKNITQRVQNNRKSDSLKWLDLRGKINKNARNDSLQRIALLQKINTQFNNQEKKINDFQNILVKNNKQMEEKIKAIQVIISKQPESFAKFQKEINNLKVSVGQQKRLLGSMNNQVGTTLSTTKIINRKLSTIQRNNASDSTGRN